jgi:hypothetical protein
MLEKDVERALTKYCRDRGVLCYKFVSPGHIGVPDRILVFPGGDACFVEVKAPGKLPTGNQVREIRRLKGNGAEVFVVDSVDGGKALVDAKLLYGDVNDPVWAFYSDPSALEVVL